MIEGIQTIGDFILWSITVISCMILSWLITSYSGFSPDWFHYLIFRILSLIDYGITSYSGFSLDWLPHIQESHLVYYLIFRVLSLINYLMLRILSLIDYLIFRILSLIDYLVFRILTLLHSWALLLLKVTSIKR